jgi:hypothetical protein
MRNRALHDALRDFALEAAALLTEDLKAGAEVEFDVVEEGVGAHRAPPGASAGRGGGRGPALYRYEPRTGAFIEERWPLLRELPACERACAELGAGASAWLRMNGLRGEQAEPALRAMLERLYEDATSFGFPEERFDRVYREVELTLYRDAVRARVTAPVRGAWMEAESVELGDGLSLVRGDRLDGPHERSELLCVLERDVPADDPIPTDEAAARFDEVVTALRLWAPGGVALGAPGWRQTDQGRWQPVGIGSGAPPRGGEWILQAGDEQAFREFFTAIAGARAPETVAWALQRFEMGCDRPGDGEALSDYLLALRALLDATTDAGQASLGLRLAALCAEDGMRQEVQGRLEAALALERFVMGRAVALPTDAGSPSELVAEVESHVRALLRDVLCGYLDADLKAVADDILIDEQEPEPEPEAYEPEPLAEIQARDLRKEPRFERIPEPDQVTFEPELEYDYDPAPEYEDELDTEPDTAEMEPVKVDGVTPSADWGWDDPEDFSAPV